MLSQPTSNEPNSFEVTYLVSERERAHGRPWPFLNNSPRISIQACSHTLAETTVLAVSPNILNWVGSCGCVYEKDRIYSHRLVFFSLNLSQEPWPFNFRNRRVSRNLGSGATPAVALGSSKTFLFCPGFANTDATCTMMSNFTLMIRK